MSVLLSLQSHKYDIKSHLYILTIKHKYIQFITKYLNYFIKFCWISSHCDIDGNETADSLAKSASQSESINFTQISYTDTYQKFKKIAENNTYKFVTELSKYKGNNISINFI